MYVFLVCSGCADITWDSGYFANEIGWGINEMGDCSDLETTHEEGDCCVDGSQDYYTIECTDSWGDGWSGHVLTIGGLVVCDSATQDWGDYWTMQFSCSDDGSGLECEVFGQGCTNAAAENYDAAAITDDGSCSYPGTWYTKINIYLLVFYQYCVCFSRLFRLCRHHLGLGIFCE